MVEEAVEEVLDLVKKAAEEFKACGGVDEFDFLMEGKALCLYCGLLICDIVQWSRWIQIYLRDTLSSSSRGFGMFTKMVLLYAYSFGLYAS